MDEKEREELLYRVDERTERMEDELMRRLNDVEKKASENSGRIKHVKEDTAKNKKEVNNIKAVIGAIGAAIIALAARAFELIT